MTGETGHGECVGGVSIWWGSDSPSGYGPLNRVQH